MKTKVSTAVVLSVLVLTLVLLSACGIPEQSLDGMVIVTFKLNGGSLNTGSSPLTGSVYHGYQPNSKVIDISNYMRYKLTKSNSDFAGWYTDENFAEDSKWDFENDVVTEDITLYAKWIDSIVYSYGVYLVVDGQDPVQLGVYEVDKGEAFEDKRSYGSNLSAKGRTFLGYYSDVQLTQPWDDSFVHPGGETSKEIPVYVDSIEGVWKFVSDYDELIAAIGTGNIMLTADIDCGGKELPFGDFGNTLQGTDMEGKSHKISNFVVVNGNNRRNPEYSIFGDLKESAKILNVTFDNITMNIESFGDTVSIRAAALAISMADGVEVNNVTVNGSYTVSITPSSRLTTTEEDIAEMVTKICFNDYKAEEVTISNFNANIVLRQD